MCALLAHRTMGRYLKKDRRGRLAIERAKVASEERLDGKYLIVTSDDSLSPEDVALSYKQLGDGRTGVADDEVGACDPADAAPPGGAHPLARAAVLAGAAAGAADRGDVPAGVAASAPGDGPVAPRGVCDGLRPFRAAHGADGAAARVSQGDAGGAAAAV